uniref:Mads box protein n=1 Tax=Solanum tuberosum TaxID=4113 RepID=M1AJM6_SOLTU
MEHAPQTVFSAEDSKYFLNKLFLDHKDSNGKPTRMHALSTTKFSILQKTDSHQMTYLYSNGLHTKLTWKKHV